MTNVIATQQPNGGWYLHIQSSTYISENGFRGKTLDEALNKIPVMDGERVTIEIGYLKRSELKANYDNS